MPAFPGQNAPQPGSEYGTKGHSDPDSRHGAVFSRDELKQKVQAALEARIISGDYARTLVALVELVAGA